MNKLPRYNVLDRPHAMDEVDDGEWVDGDAAEQAIAKRDKLLQDFVGVYEAVSASDAGARALSVLRASPSSSLPRILFHDEASDTYAKAKELLSDE